MSTLTCTTIVDVISLAPIENWSFFFVVFFDRDFRKLRYMTSGVDFKIRSFLNDRTFGMFQGREFQAINEVTEHMDVPIVAHAVPSSVKCRLLHNLIQFKNQQARFILHCFLLLQLKLRLRICHINNVSSEVHKHLSSSSHSVINNSETCSVYLKFRV